MLEVHGDLTIILITILEVHLHLLLIEVQVIFLEDRARVVQAEEVEERIK